MVADAIKKLTHSVAHLTPLKNVPSSVGSEHLGHLQTKNFVSAKWASRCAVPHSTSVYEMDRCPPLLIAAAAVLINR